MSAYNTWQTILTYDSLYGVLKESVRSVETPSRRYLVIILFLPMPLLLSFFEILTPISTRKEAYGKIFPALVPLLWAATSV